MITGHHWFVVFVCASVICIVLPLITLWVVSLLWAGIDAVRHFTHRYQQRSRHIPHRPHSRFDGARTKL